MAVGVKETGAAKLLAPGSTLESHGVVHIAVRPSVHVNAGMDGRADIEQY
jgi:hypothetical protein